MPFLVIAAPEKLARQPRCRSACEGFSLTEAALEAEKSVPDTPVVRTKAPGTEAVRYEEPRDIETGLLERRACLFVNSIFQSLDDALNNSMLMRPAGLIIFLRRYTFYTSGSILCFSKCLINHGNAHGLKSTAALKGIPFQTGWRKGVCDALLGVENRKAPALAGRGTSRDW